jgi:diguanylate cyclase (GGDEF)-like protein/putative nucleotidyltransferase with HDIG domain
VLEAEKHLKEQEELYLRTVESLAVAVEVNDETTYGHIRRVKVYANELARLCGVTNPNELKAIQTGALLHDIGKLVIDDYILNKPGRLSKQEFEKVKMHVQAGNEILQQIQFPFPVAEYVGCHHERWDGLGYPNGLKGEQIPLGGRILAIADAFDAIRYSRPYKLPVNIEEAIEMLRSQSGTAYDPRLVQLFIENIDELEKLAFNQSKNMPELSFRQSLVALDKAISDSGFSNESSILNNCPAEILRLAEFCSAAAGCLDYSDLFPILSRRIESLIALSACTFYLDNGSGWVEARYAAGAFSEMLIKHKIPMGKGISGWVAAHRQPMFNTEPALEFQELEKDFSVFKNAMAVPIILGEECLGAICVYGKDPAPYSSDNLGILKAIAGFAAPAIAEIRNRRDLKPEDFIDPATRLHRFSYLTAVGPQLLASAEKSRAPVSAVYFEIRNMHRIFRTYGADAGNSILKGIADCIKPELRETDILVRYGNRAFVAILPGMRDDQALRCIERLRQQIRMRRFHLGDRSLSIDCAAGFSSYPNGGAAIFSLIQSAQQSALSKSHKTGASANKVIGFKTRF